jgi:two-component system response regulator AdeR
MAQPQAGVQGPLVLVVEDEPILAQTIEVYLRSDGCRTERAGDGARALALFRAARPDLILLDLGLPIVDGVEVLREVRRSSQVPVIILTARAEEIDELLGLGLGADGFLVKPVSARKLMAHVKAVLRRSDAPRGHGEDDTFRLGRLEVDTYRMQARVGDVGLELTPSEFRLLLHMARTPGRAVSRTELYEAALPEGDALERAVDIHITNLRRKLREAGADGMVDTVRGVGYTLVSPR